MLAAEVQEGSSTTRGAWLLWLPFATLAVSVLLVLAAGDALQPSPDFGTMLPAVAATAAWMAFFVNLHPQWNDRRGIMLFFLIGMLGWYALLVWMSPLFGFFTWTGYLFIGYALDGLWRLVAVVPVAATAGLSQVGGLPTLSAEGGYIFWAFAVLINVLIAGVMFYVEIQTEKNSVKRARMIVELADTNRKLEAALRENAGLHAQLLVQAREAGVLDERQRMAGEIHDVLAQGLTGIVTQLEAADAAAARPADHGRHLETAKRLARESLAEARRSVQALRPQQLVGTALPEALAEVVETWSERSGVKAELVTTGTPQRLLPEIETTLLRTAQEGLANVARHAAARRVGLTLSYMEDVVTLDVRDDGAGFDPERPRPAGGNGGYGLQAMRERLTRIAGRLEIESEPGGGTAISACVPAVVMGAAA
ncbi:sensor histidine kinase [Actinoplanes sp. NPDC023714]|uniref:sensor histidine kinase n=1 Tax=Actinoplanes sp. NPDC023714 TaxID=3154322 RepID=UPI0033F8F597